MVKYFYDVWEDVCIGCGACILISKELFTLKDKKAHEVKKFTEDPDEIEKLKLASKICPVNAIIIEKIEE